MGNSIPNKDDLDDDLKKLDKNLIDKVIDKILANPGNFLNFKNIVYRERLRGEDATMKKFAKVLSSTSDLKRTYLTTDWVETVNFVKFFLA